MRQWRDVKSRHRDALVFFRVGDFYELFHGDAEEGARLLGLTLTSRNNGAAKRVPLAGVPAKALDEYLARLVRLGRRVAICDQVEDPAEAKGIVRREVTETVTPGTVVDEGLLAARRNTFLASVVCDVPEETAVASLDLSTGELFVRSVAAGALGDELGRLEPSELLAARSSETVLAGDGAAGPGVPITYRDDWLFDARECAEAIHRAFGVLSLDGLGFQAEDESLVRAVGALLQYVAEIRPGGVTHLRPPRLERDDGVMVLDDMTRRNLELVQPLRPDDGRTLLEVVDAAETAMGGRLLRRWLLHPLVDAPSIWERQEAVSDLFDDRDRRTRVRERLGRVADLERLAGKLGTGKVNPRDLRALARSLDELPGLRQDLADDGPERLRALVEDLDTLADVCAWIDSAIAADPPASLADGGVIREGHAQELDELRSLRDGARDFIAGLQARERERTGIASLKVGFNKVFGYYLEVTRANLDRVPDEYHRKQTLANAERYFTPELKEWEERVVDAEDRVTALEAELFAAVRARVAAEVGRLQRSAERVAHIDVFAAFAETAERNAYVRPEVHTGFDLHVEAGRHPVVETMMPREAFIPNDIDLVEGARLIILTGPNMAGKSTVLRQVGLIQLLAQIGAYVPANRARVPVVDRIFTRVGASDNLARGQSTFMVEMNETAAILNGATERSLVLLDEIGRGTSTYDGVSIAWAVSEHLHEHTRAKTVFATHYHELTQLGDLLPEVENLNVSVREVGDDIVFLRRLEEGGADRSYGIQVARLAGLPRELILRARELLVELEGTHTGGGEGLGRRGRHRPESEAPPHQLTFFQVEHPVLRQLRELDPNELTPLEALNLLARWRRDVTG